MMSRIEILTAALLLAVAAPLTAQEADTTAAAAEAPTVVADPAPETAAEAHDWEFTLAATDQAPGASASVMVTEAEAGSGFVLVANGLPVIDSLDREGRDVNAYTVWVVPGKDKVAESELVGVLTVTPEGTGRIEGETALQSFGVIVTATADGAPDRIGGVPVLTGIPVRQEAPAEAADEAAEAAEDVSGEMADEDPDMAQDVEEEIAEGVSDVQEEEAEAAEEDPNATP